jgi:type II secretory pathway pseudopilin PulG
MELLVSIGIIAVLAGLIIAIAGPIRRKSQEGICASHLSKIWNAMMIYRLNNGGSEGFAGDHVRLGLPPEFENPATHQPYVCDFDTWRCPAPKRPTQNPNELPQYEYVPIVASEGDTTWYMDAISRYGTRVPLITDINHNDWSKVNIWAPRVKKHILYIDLNGAYNSKFVWRPYTYRDISFYELEN